MRIERHLRVVVGGGDEIGEDEKGGDTERFPGGEILGSGGITASTQRPEDLPAWQSILSRFFGVVPGQVVHRKATGIFVILQGEPALPLMDFILREARCRFAKEYAGIVRKLRARLSVK